MHLKVRSHLSLLGAIHCIFKDYCNACCLTSSLLLRHIKSCILRKSCGVGDQSNRSVLSTVAIGHQPQFCLLTQRLGELLACICVRSHENTKQLRCRKSQEGDSCRGSSEATAEPRVVTMVLWDDGQYETSGYCTFELVIKI